MKNKKITIALIIAAFILIINVIIGIKIIGNATYVKRYINRNYPNYIIIEKNYEYLNQFWATYYETDRDKMFSEVICNTTIKNKNTGMYVTIPFSHSIMGSYKDPELGEKSIKKMVKKYERYWKNINRVTNKYNIDINISNVEISEAYNNDIYDMTIYIKSNNTDIYEAINEIEKLNTSLDIENIYYVVANEEVYNTLSPWTEANRYIIERKMKPVKNKSEADFYILKKGKDRKNVDYYKVKNDLE